VAAEAIAPVRCGSPLHGTSVIVQAVRASTAGTARNLQLVT